MRQDSATSLVAVLKSAIVELASFLSNDISSYQVLKFVYFYMLASF